MSNDTNDMANLFTEITGVKSVKENQDKTSQGSRIRDADSEARPTTRVICPSCENNKAYYEMKQIRAADESETRFFECVKCNYKWREDDH